MLFNIFQHSLVTFTLADLMKFRCGAKEKKKVLPRQKIYRKDNFMGIRKTGKLKWIPQKLQQLPTKAKLLLLQYLD